MEFKLFFRILFAGNVYSGFAAQSKKAFYLL